MLNTGNVENLVSKFYLVNSNAQDNDQLGPAGARRTAPYNKSAHCKMWLFHSYFLQFFTSLFSCSKMGWRTCHWSFSKGYECLCVIFFHVRTWYPVCTVQPTFLLINNTLLGNKCVWWFVLQPVKLFAWCDEDCISKWRQCMF